MKKLKSALAVFFAFLFLLLCSCGAKQEDETDKAAVETTENVTESATDEYEGKETIIAYFAYDELSKKAAEALSEKLDGAAVYAIETVNGYSDNEEERAATARKELEENARPILKNGIKTLKDCVALILITPMWEENLPMAVYTFAGDFDFRDRAAITVCTSGSAEKCDALVNDLFSGSLMLDTVMISSEEDFEMMYSAVEEGLF